MRTFGLGTKANYLALTEKNPAMVYFLSDTREIYFGNNKYGGSIAFVTAAPTTGDYNTLYVVNNGADGIYTFIPGEDGSPTAVQIVKGITTTITETATDNQLPTAKAVYDYVVSKVGFGTNGLAMKPTYDAETRKITIPVVGEDENVVINLGKDLVVENGELVDGEGDNEGKKFIKLTLTSGDTIMININELVDIYTGGATSTATVTVDPTTNIITVAVKVSAVEGNQLVAKDDGLYVAKSIADENVLSGDEDVIPSSKAVKDYIDTATTIEVFAF